MSSCSSLAASNINFATVATSSLETLKARKSIKIRLKYSEQNADGHHRYLESNYDCHRFREVSPYAIDSFHSFAGNEEERENHCCSLEASEHENII